jgi:hypothetical protein
MDMAQILPAEDRVLIRAVADSLVVAADPDAASAAKAYWRRSRPWLASVVNALGGLSDTEVSVAGKHLMANPRSLGAYQEFCLTLDDAVTRNPSGIAELLQISWAAECNSRIGYHIGRCYGSQLRVKVDVDALIAARGRAVKKPVHEAAALIVIPFRASAEAPLRLRNAVACLCALADQSAERVEYQVVVVESDEKPRWRHVLAPLCDQYIFAAKSGSFNKSWTVNVGARQAAGLYDVICILDADSLPDRDFVKRNTDRFRKAGVQAFLPFREVLWVDDEATKIALESRLIQGVADPDQSFLRGFVIRRPPGFCFWIRFNIYAAVGGMDERYEGWGGEDTDFALRVSTVAALDRHEDLGIHLYHPASAVTVNSRISNSNIPIMSWPKDADFGQLDRFHSNA